MRLLIAFLLPWLTFFTIGRPLSGIICLLLQLTVIGWIPATIWAVLRIEPVQDRSENRECSRRSPDSPPRGMSLPHFEMALRARL